MIPPIHPLPEPLRAVEKPSFTHYSVVVRLPDIVRRALTENDYPPETVERLNKLIDDIPQGNIRPVDIGDNDFTHAWTEYVYPFLGMDWLEVPWFFAEEYFYIRLLEATGYFQSGAWHLRDPFANQKRLGLESTREDINRLTVHVAAALERPADTYLDALSHLFLVDLWGNQNDLSLWPVHHDTNSQTFHGGAAANHKLHLRKDEREGIDELRSAEEHLLVDDRSALLAFVNDQNSGHTRIDLLLDNAGYELIADLVLTDFLLTSRIADQVVLHGKPYPVFVSDALEQDIHNAFDYLAFTPIDPARATAIRLRQRLLDERLKLLFDPYWISPLPAWQMPDELITYLNGSSLLISKGDANYRRLLGDRHWPLDMPFSAVVNYLKPAVLSLRTMKSETGVGIPLDRVPMNDPDWMSNGHWGLIQYSPPKHNDR